MIPMVGDDVLNYLKDTVRKLPGLLWFYSSTKRIYKSWII